MITPDEIADVPLFAAMPEALRARIASRSADLRVNAGETIVHEGDAPHFWVLLEGEVEMLQRYGGETQQVTTFEPSEFFGEIPLMLSTSSPSELRTMTPARLMRIEQADFHLMLTASVEASALITSTLVRRVSFRRDVYVAANVTEAAIVGDRYDFACHDLRDFLARNQIPYEWLDPNDAGDAAEMPAGARNAAAYPVVILAGGRQLVTPTLRELAEGLNLQTVPGSGW
jgi:thioredoxin reductase (NADPH)